ncbi:GNAT family N-acetyltransferase [Paracoccus beibuensis]|uniref:GNAT family N-acetyltransferase n=1 Tax=Paracoccus beibuensis TaxID=547602 RepID=UPI002240DF3E|nr:GNAT family N-acetyltransferase [Paracoccus beibuensis]
MPPEIRIRPVTAGDLPMLALWLARPEVARWWPDPKHQLGLVREDLDEAAMTQVIAMDGDTPLGYAQYSPAHHWPAPHFADLPADAIAIDVFGGPKGMGRGGEWLRALADELLERTSLLAIDPDPENLRAVRAYRKAGFSGDHILRDGEGAPVRVMTRRR